MLDVGMAACLLLGTAGSRGDEGLKNPDFEEGDVGSSPAGWTLTTKGGTTTSGEGSIASGSGSAIGRRTLRDTSSSRSRSTRRLTGGSWSAWRRPCGSTQPGRGTGRSSIEEEWLLAADLDDPRRRHPGGLDAVDRQFGGHLIRFALPDRNRIDPDEESI
jgi:hypothetical protein